MHHARRISIACLLLLLGAGAFAQEAAKGDDPAGADDLFPSVVLEIEDLSIEKIEAGLPLEEPLMTFERQIPLPGPGEIRVLEPGVDTLLPGTEGGTDGAAKSFFTDVLFGAGLENNLLGEITFYRLGLPPLIRLLFAYENMDGIAYRQIGLGYGDRRDEFAGGVKYQNEWLSLEADAGFRERERGLQERTAYFSTLNQFSHLNLAFTATAAELFSFSAEANGAVTGFSVTGSAAPPYPVSYPPTEYLAGGKVKAQLAWTIARAALGAEYRYRNIPGDAAFEVHRFRADLTAGFDPVEQFHAEGAVGIFTNTAIPYLVPWQLSARWVVFDWLSVSAGGGYRIQESNLAGLLPESSYADFPASLPDNHGWFGRAGTQVSFSNLLLLTVDAVFSENVNYPHLAAAPDAATGLFPLEFASEVPVFTLDCRAKLPLAAWLSVSGVNRVTLPLAPPLPAFVRIGAEIAAEETSGAFGGKAAVSFTTDAAGQWEFPYLDASVFVRLLDHMKLSVEALDLLQPVLGQARVSPYPYLAPGIRARFKIEISL